MQLGIDQLTNDVLIIPRWFRLDNNFISPSYVLQKISTFLPEFFSTDKKVQGAAQTRWWGIFGKKMVETVLLANLFA